LIRIPLVGTVVGGPWTQVYDQSINGGVEEWVYVSGKISPSSFALRVDGDSMEPEFHEGDVIVVDPDIQAVHNDYVIAKIPKTDSLGDEGEATLKQLVIDGPNIYLKPKNPDYDKINVIEKRFRIVGVVKERTARQYR